VKRTEEYENFIRIAVYLSHMKKQELKSDAKIIFEKELFDLSNGNITFAFITAKKETIFFYPNAQTLIDLFSMVQNDEKLKSYFVRLLETEIADSEEASPVGEKFHRYPFVGVSHLCFYTLMELGFRKEAMDSLKKRRQGFEGIYSLICRLISKDYFNSIELKEILTIVRTHIGTQARQLEYMIVKSRYELLGKQITKVNVEINQDKKAVSEKIFQFGFDKSYNDLLEGIDKFINAETSNFVNAGMISNLRTFMGNLFKDVASKIAEQNDEKIPTINVHGEMGCIRSYLKTNLALSDRDDKFITSFVDILHKEGGHSFMSEKEYFRLARNIAIEVALFLLTKYEKMHLS
jgi:hypothetical protein